MGTPVGTRQEVIQAVEDTLQYQLMIDCEPATVTAATIVIYDYCGNELVASTVATFSGSVASYTRTWELATFELDVLYRAVWSLTSGGKVHKRETWFDVVRRDFTSQLIDSQLTDLYSYLTEMLPSGVTSFATWRRMAWKEITDRLRLMATEKFEKRYKSPPDGWRRRRSFSPGNTCYPEAFIEAHRHLSLWLFFRSQIFEPDGEDSEKIEYHRKRGWHLFDQAAARLDFDFDQDAKISPDERLQKTTSIGIFR